jgi:hypothetical protein
MTFSEALTTYCLPQNTIFVKSAIESLAGLVSVPNNKKYIAINFYGSPGVVDITSGTFSSNQILDSNSYYHACAPVYSFRRAVYPCPNIKSNNVYMVNEDMFYSFSLIGGTTKFLNLKTGLMINLLPPSPALSLIREALVTLQCLEVIKP